MTEHPDKDLLHRAWRADTRRHEDGRHCPSDEAIFEAATGGADADQRRRVIEHIALCGACAQSWRLAAELEHARPGVARAEHRFGHNRRPGNLALAAAATVVAAIGIVWLLPQFDPGTPPPGNGSVLRGVEEDRFNLAGPDVFRPGDGIVLSWRALEGAKEYRVSIFDEHLETLFAQTVTTARLALPGDALDAAADGDTVYWFVQAEMADGSRHRSETATAILRRDDGSTDPAAR
jgi:hypothetical protein